MAQVETEVEAGAIWDVAKVRLRGTVTDNWRVDYPMMTVTHITVGKNPWLKLPKPVRVKVNADLLL